MAPPTKPSERDAAYLRFVDPSDPTKLMALSLTDTGILTADGLKIYALGTAGAGGTTSTNVLLDKILHQFIGAPTQKQLYTPPKQDLVWTESEQVMEAALPVVSMGKGIKWLTSEFFAILAGATYEAGSKNVFSGSRIVGALQHDFTNAAPGKLILLIGPEPSLAEITQPNTTVIEIPLNDSNNLSVPSPNNRVTWSLERTSPYFKYKVVSLAAITRNVKMTASLGVM